MIRAKWSISGRKTRDNLNQYLLLDTPLTIYPQSDVSHPSLKDDPHILSYMIATNNTFGSNDTFPGFS